MAPTEAQKSSGVISSLGLEPKDWLTLLLVLVAVVSQWTMFQSRVSALEDAVKPVPQVVTDMAVVKNAILDIRDDLQTIKERHYR